MIITLAGNNSFLLQQELHLLTSEFVKEYTDMGLERFDGEEAEFDRMREALESLPFLASKKLVVLRAPSANKEFVEKAEKLLAEVPETTDVIIYEPKLDKRSVYYKFLKKKTGYKEFSELDEYGLSRWLGERAKTKGGSLNSGDTKYLIERLGANQQLLSNELDKLLAYNPAITRESINMLTEPNPQSTVFQLMDAAFAGNKKQVLKLYQEQRASKVEPQQIIALLAWQLHILAVVKTAGERSDRDIAAEAKINPYVVGKSRAIARNLSLARLKELVSQLTELDLQLKTTAIDADDGVQAYLLSV
ncbi:MAG TPA: DNA polymerase III subunit delta [Candidatus Saccharimonadales bacterium]|nr:DNA polymerase III subunit delta [Candidatus Saccharimonadales bacterium]